MRYADKNGGKCKIPVYVIMDEFANIGQIPDFHKKLATMRSRLISVMIIIQNAPQIQALYPNNTWSDIFSNCDQKLLLGATDVITAKYFCELLRYRYCRNCRKKNNCRA